MAEYSASGSRGCYNAGGPTTLADPPGGRFGTRRWSVSARRLEVKTRLSLSLELGGRAVAVATVANAASAMKAGASLGLAPASLNRDDD